MEEKKELMRQLAAKIREANDAYYNQDKELLSNHEWDALYDQLQQLEAETGIVLPDSPTQTVGSPISDSLLTKVHHKEPVLSLDKTKQVSVLETFLGDQEGVLSWKLDGLTVVLTYENGRLAKAVTRGNGLIGEDITDHARYIKDIPMRIPLSDEVTIRGEALIFYEDFEQINASLPAGEEPYKNPRNLCAGSLRQKNSEEVAKRQVRFRAFSMVSMPNRYWTIETEFLAMSNWGFSVVPHTLVTKNTLADTIKEYERNIAAMPFPSDGLVLKLNDVAYGLSLGTTAKYPKNALAFKWADDCKKTTLEWIEWSTGRTGYVTPVAVFSPVELEGTTVTRASVHNVEILKQLHLVPGDTISVYKANMIIPQIAKNHSPKSEKPVIPTHCPVCHMRLMEKQNNLWCKNTDCPARKAGAFAHAVKRDAFDIEGLGDQTISDFIQAGLLKELGDLFRLGQHKEEILALDGYGEITYQNLVKSIEKARHMTLDRLLYALGIETIGRTASKAICAHFQYDVTRTVYTVTEQELLRIPDVGPIMAKAYCNWFANYGNQEIWEDLQSEVQLEMPSRPTVSQSLRGITIVVTGGLNHFATRDAFKLYIESLGGKLTGSVSKKTNFLITNDALSTTTKSQKARELNIPVLTEDQFLAQFQLKGEM